MSKDRIKVVEQYVKEGGVEYQQSKGRIKLNNPYYREIRADYFARLLAPYLPKGTKNILEFGSGSAQNLSKLNVEKKYAYEPSEFSREQAKVYSDIVTVGSLKEFDNDFFDIIMSIHSLEHTLQPYEELLRLYALLKPGGILIIILPFERNRPFRSNDPNYHLYCWTQLTIGNLLTEIGFYVKDTRRYFRAGELKLGFIRKYSVNIWILLSQVYGFLRGVEDSLIISEKPILDALPGKSME